MKTDIMGIAFDNVTMQEALDKASAILRGDKTCYAVTPNAEIAYEAMKDERLRALINGAGPRSAGWCGRGAGVETPENAPKAKGCGRGLCGRPLGAFG